MAVIVEHLRRLGSAIPFPGRETHRLPFDERWQNAPYNPSEIDGAGFVRREISDLISRMRKNLAHTEAVLPNLGVGFQIVSLGERKMYGMELPDLAEQPLDDGLKNPLLAHLADRRANSELWHGEPAVGISLYTDKYMGYRSVGIELMIGTVDPNDGVEWADRGRQGISVQVDNIVIATANWGWRPTEVPGPNLRQMFEYVRATPHFKVAKELCRVAENVIDVPQQSTAN